MNDIVAMENTPEMLRLLLAQRRMYSKGKSIFGAQLLLTVTLVVICSLFVLVFPDFKLYAALWGTVATIVDLLVLTRWQASIREGAAKVQELFDCAVLKMEWNEICVGRPPAMEIIARFSALPEGESFSTMKLTNWYSVEVSPLPLSIARAACQRANCWWTATLRHRIAGWAVGIVIVLFLFTLLVGMLGRVPMDQWVKAGLIPWVPVAVLGLRQYSEQTAAAKRLDRLREHAEDYWYGVLRGRVSPSEAGVKARLLQDEIFGERKRNPLVFDWVFWCLRDRQEDEMNRTTAQLAAEANRFSGFKAR